MAPPRALYQSTQLFPDELWVSMTITIFLLSRNMLFRRIGCPFYYPNFWCLQCYPINVIYFGEYHFFVNLSVVPGRSSMIAIPMTCRDNQGNNFFWWKYTVSYCAILCTYHAQSVRKFLLWCRTDYASFILFHCSSIALSLHLPSRFVPFYQYLTRPVWTLHFAPLSPKCPLKEHYSNVSCGVRWDCVMQNFHVYGSCIITSSIIGYLGALFLGALNTYCTTV